MNLIIKSEESKLLEELRGCLDRINRNSSYGAFGDYILMGDELVYTRSKKPYKMRLVIDETITEDMDNKSKPKVTNVNPDTLVNNNLW